jgi:signal transduction histidine kinase
MRLNVRWRSGSSAYIILALLVPASAATGLVLSWTSLGLEFDNYAYDFLFRAEPPALWQPSSIILAIDEQTLAQYGGYPVALRGALADGLDRIQAAHPAAVAVDTILSDPGDPALSARLEEAFSRAHNLVLSADLLPDGSGWEEPLPRFRKYAAEVGEAHAALDTYDAISRALPLEKIAGRQRLWALSLAAYRTAHGAEILESQDDLTVGNVRIPSSIRDEAHQRHGRLLGDERLMRIRFAPAGLIPSISVAQLDRDPALAMKFAGKVVFAGLTAQTAIRDRWMTPSSSGVMAGVELHANAYETIARQMFLVDASPVAVAASCLALAACAGLIYVFLAGRVANVAALLLAAASQAIPAAAFARSIVWPWLPGTLSAGLALVLAASWRHLLVRRALVQAGEEKNRYQQAMQFVTHEMRTPLTAIQGSSELISRYGAMPEAKRKQMAELINSESKRLARMIETFLSVERLSAGEMEMKQERFPLAALVERCTERARPFADRKRIEIEISALPPDDLTGDRELMEYAVYNLLTNAVKYSPSNTRVRVFGEDDRGDRVRLSIEDQGIGMDKKEVSRIFEKFYRTKRAEQSGEAGTGIGLSIVEQIVTQHGGSIHVESEPGKGSRFTLVLKRAS